VVGIASTARDLTSDARINIQDIQASTSTIGISTVSTRLRVSGTIGVSTNSPQADIHIVNASDASLHLTGNQSTITLGRSSSPTGENSSGLKFGNTSGLYSYSTQKTLDVFNYDTGNLNSYLHYSSTAGVGTGNFNWIYGQIPGSPLMSLTYQGNLGIGITDPVDKLEVDGNVIITGSLFVDNDITAIGSGTSTSVDTLYVYGGATALLDSAGNELFPTGSGNVNITSGISTFFDININNNAFFNGNIGIGTTDPQDPIQIGAATTLGEYVSISEFGIGLGTAANFNGFFIDAGTKEVLFGAVSIGSTEDVIGIPDNHLLYVEGTSEFNGNVGIGTTNPTSALTVVGNALVSGITTTNSLNIGTGVTISAGIVTATDGFTSGIGTAIQIITIGNILTFTVPGVGSTSLTLY